MTPGFKPFTELENDQASDCWELINTAMTMRAGLRQEGFQ